LFAISIINFSSKGLANLASIIVISIPFLDNISAVLNFGTRLEECKKASELFSKKGIDITIMDARFAKPLDEKLIMEAANNHEVLISIEEGSVGGFGSHVMQF
jgi:deoxyxylulose-5-phosphate synthase